MNPFKAKAKREAEAAAVQAAPMTKLEERREELREKFTELQFDLGGAAYEMAARDYFRLDVLAKMAARLQLVDAELAEIERMARLEKAGASGSCPGCGSLHAQGAIYCWRCGRNLHETVHAVVSPLASVPSATTSPGYQEPVQNGHDHGLHAVDPGPVKSPPSMESAIDPGLVVGTPEDFTRPGFSEEVVDIEPGPRNHPNVDPDPEADRGQRPDWPPA